MLRWKSMFMEVFRVPWALLCCQRNLALRTPIGELLKSKIKGKQESSYNILNLSHSAQRSVRQANEQLKGSTEP